MKNKITVLIGCVVIMFCSLAAVAGISNKTSSPQPVFYSSDKGAYVCHVYLINIDGHKILVNDTGGLLEIKD